MDWWSYRGSERSGRNRLEWNYAWQEPVALCYGNILKCSEVDLLGKIVEDIDITVSIRPSHIGSGSSSRDDG